jgi:D-alanine transaminase
LSIAYLNGVWQPAEEARVSVLDRGFLFGDGVYEVIPVFNGRVFAEDRHLARMARSLGQTGIKPPMSNDCWKHLFAEGIRRVGEVNAVLYVQITRGVSRARSHNYQNEEPTVLVLASGWPEYEQRPHDVVTMEDFRWSRADIKATSLVASGMIRNGAIADGYDDAILIRDGKVTEASASNVFIALDGMIVTPPASRYLLHGITRAVVIELAAAHGLPLQEREITHAELMAANEVWLTSTTHEVWPVASIDRCKVGSGEPGPLTNQVNSLYQAYKRSQTASSVM